MAEFVQRRIEERIPELEQLERIGLLTGKEVRVIVKKVTSLEYKLQRRTVEKQDFLTYLQYEVHLLSLIKKRRQRIGYYFKKEDIEYVIVQRIHKAFQRATSKWQEDLQLWYSHVSFCKQWNCKHQISKIFSALLAVHSDKPTVWLMAAKWEIENNLSVESSRHIFLRALRFHPESPLIYQEYFRMELLNAEKQRKEKEEMEKAKMDLDEAGYLESILEGELARVVYKSAVQTIKGAQFHLSLLSIAKEFDFTQDLQKEILTDLQSLHAQDPFTWDFMAQQELTVESLPSTEYSSKKAKATDMLRREERCSKIYETALESLNTESMWELYIVSCRQRYKRKTNCKELKQMRQERLFNAYRKAHEASMLAEEKYIEWISELLALGETDSIVGASEAAIKRYSQSAKLWQTRLEILVKLGQTGIDQVFEEAFKHFKPKDSVFLWTLKVEWSEKTKDEEATEALYKQAIVVPASAVSISMKELYLDWAYRTKGYKKAKKVFTSLHESRPLSEEFFHKMITIEKEQEHGKMQNLREYYERALREFGTTSSDLWLDYIKEELNHGEGKPQNCGTIHWRAMKMLEGKDVESFVSNYTLLQTGKL
ncbi:UTP6 small subunit processome component L homeolog [Xenopus laevis]|uniref:MGC53963 protein n=2 Tax=Xenopus laevis TaxID=8355 RepID=Q802C0_XENLA|nr:UTP6 small subunit processome component L homeolog [Xenopus laevis]AAH48226.1 MGC53963 protein [Xenopus laevis]OCT63199.1 hypothetical protein XELAEV_18044297mg [Xenopus laevis]